METQIFYRTLPKNFIMNKEERERLSNFLKNLRGEESQRNFSRTINCSYTALRSWENAECVPGYEALLKISECANINIYQLLAIIRDEDISKNEKTLNNLKIEIEGLNREEKLEIARFIMNLI